MKTRYRIFGLLFAILCSATALMAQTEPEMAFSFRESGKIYVVVGVLTIIMTGLAVYLYLLDKRISRLEQMK